MCRSLRKYKCGTCAACYSIKRNSLAIRLREHYNGYLRHYSKNQYAVLFGMLTFDDEHLPPIQTAIINRFILVVVKSSVV